MKKRFFTVIIVAIASALSLFLLACGGDTTAPPANEHTHTADSYEITKAATCTEDGEKTGVCSICGETFTAAVAATGHDWYLQSEIEATCTEDGVAVYKCGECFADYEHVTEAFGHDGGTVIAAVPASCETVGFTEGRSCSRCGTIIIAPEQIDAVGHKFYYEKRSNDTHAIHCENCNYSQIADCEFEEIEIAPTCLEAGRLIHTCIVCGDTHEHETTAALGHLWTENWSFYRTVDGVYKHRKTCYRCEAYQEEGCSNNEEGTVLPTCEKIGYTTYFCNGCGNTYNSDFTDALGHDWSNYVLDDDNADPYKHTHSRRCLRQECDASETDVPVGVVGMVISVRTDETCESDAYTVYTCSLDSCVYKHTETYTDSKLGHSFGEWKYTGDNDDNHEHTHYCLRTGCSASETEKCNMTTSSQAATCTKPEVDVSICADCFHVDTDEYPALGHKWSDWISIGVGGSPMHTHVCTVCNLREYGSHSLETTTTQADCEHNEATVNTCSVCGYTTRTDRPGTALGHDWEVISSDSNEHHLVCRRTDTHDVTALHDYTASNLCSYCSYDGLTYELSVSGEYFVVKNDNGVPRASEITVASSRPNPQNLAETIPVRMIGASAFSHNKSLKKVLLPATVTAIESYAFNECTALVTVEFYGGESQLNRIELGAFYNCSALTSISLSDTLRSIGNVAFYGCTRLNDIPVPESVAEIGLSAFYNTGFYNNRDNWHDGALYAGLYLVRVDNAYFTDAGEFSIKANTISVSERAFEDCVGITKVFIPISVKTIGSDAFSGCKNLEEVEYAGGVSDWFAITFVNTLSSPMYYAKRMRISGEENSTLKLPENITSIPAGTFKGNTVITSVVIPSTVTSIGDEAFMDCINLVDISFDDDRVTYMGKDAFFNTGFYKAEKNWVGGILILDECHILATDDTFDQTSYAIDDGIRTISAGAFAKRNITELTVGLGVVWFGAEAFNVSALQSVTFNNISGTWFAKNAGGALRLVTVTENAVSNASLLKNYTGEWRKNK